MAHSFVDFDGYDRRARSRPIGARRMLGACTLLCTGMVLGVLVERSRVAASVLL